MHAFTFALMTACILGSPLMAEECPAPEKIIEGLKKVHEEMRKTIGKAARIKPEYVSLPYGLPEDEDLRNLSQSEHPDFISPEYKNCLYTVEGMEKPFVIITVKK